MGEEKTWQKYTKVLRGKWALLLLALLGVLLLLLSSGQGAGSAGQGTAGGVGTAAEAEAYRTALREELTTLCSRVQGAGQVSLVITLSGGEEAVYAVDHNGEGRTDHVLSGGEGLLLSYQNPTVVGVGVVCEGGQDAAVRRELTALLSATLGIGSNRIYITCGT